MILNTGKHNLAIHSISWGAAFCLSKGKFSLCCGTPTKSNRGIDMTAREDVLDYGMTLPDVYIDAPFRDDNWVLLRCKKNGRAFAWTYERNGNMCVNVKVDKEWRDFWRSTYEAVIPGYHQNKEHWNTIILNGTVPENDIKRMIAESYDLVKDKR